MGKYCGPHPTPPPPGAPIPPPPTTHQQGHKAGAKEICALKYASFVVGWSLEEAMASSASSEHADPEALYLVPLLLLFFPHVPEVLDGQPRHFLHHSGPLPLTHRLTGSILRSVHGVQRLPEITLPAGSCSTV